MTKKQVHLELSKGDGSEFFRNEYKDENNFSIYSFEFPFGNIDVCYGNRNNLAGYYRSVDCFIDFINFFPKNKEEMSVGFFNSLEGLEFTQNEDSYIL